MTIARIPRRFYDDCVECDTLTPPVVKKTERHYWVDLSKADPDAEDDYRAPFNDSIPKGTPEETLADFTSRAVLYADPDHFGSEYRYLQQSAKATLKVITEESSI